MPCFSMDAFPFHLHFSYHSTPAFSFQVSFFGMSKKIRMLFYARFFSS